jgi:hypothetical protein
VPEPENPGPIRWHFCVPAWLMINSMRMEALQFMQLNVQVRTIFGSQPLTTFWLRVTCATTDQE